MRIITSGGIWRSLLIAGCGLAVIISLLLAGRGLTPGQQEYHCSRSMEHIAGMLVYDSVMRNAALSPVADVNGMLKRHGIVNQCPITKCPYRILIDAGEHRIIIMEDRRHDGTIKEKKEFILEFPAIEPDEEVVLWRRTENPSGKVFGMIFLKCRDDRNHTWRGVGDFKLFGRKFDKDLRRQLGEECADMPPEPSAEEENDAVTALPERHEQKMRVGFFQRLTKDILSL